LIPLRFGILGGRPEQVSLLGRKVIENLLRAGCHLEVWLPAEPETPLPWNLGRPAPWAGVVGSTAPIALDSIDFLIQLDPSWPAPELLSIPRYGVWRFATPNPGPLAFWDVFDGLYYLEIRLDRLTADPHRCISLDRRWVKVDRLSYCRTLDAVIEEMAGMPAYAAGGDLDNPAEPVAFPPQRIETPSAADLATLRAKILWRNLNDRLRRLLFSNAWRAGVLDAPITRFLELDYLPSVRWLPSPREIGFLADPSAGCHMSNPFLLRHEDQLYWIPEAYRKEWGCAWRWNPSSRVWSEMRPLPGGVACIDPMPVFFKGRWWLFYTDKNDGPDSKLRIRYADSPHGPWQPHTRNPVKVDVRSSRPGGPPFVYRGKLYRIAQDCSKMGYGWRLAVNQVTRLAPDEFAEEVIRIIDSERLGVESIHMLSGVGDMTVIVAKSR